MERKQVSNTPITPWLELLIQGEKTFEGRIADPNSIWSRLKVGDKLVFFSGTLEATFEVRGSVHAINFDELYAICGDKLVPPVIFTNTQSTSADQIYENILLPHNPNYRDMINAFGVVGVCVVCIA
jgi:ASC-1-like (ASCH) protein